MHSVGGVIFVFCLCFWWQYAGPNLSGLFGRTSGTTAGYSFSTANKTKEINWNENTLYEYLLNPKKVCTLRSSHELHCRVPNNCNFSILKG
jgi:hypothetical protein